MGRIITEQICTIHFLDHILLQMKDRFSQEFAVVTELFSLVSGLRPNLPCQDSDIRDAVKFYAHVVDETRLSCELKSWNAKWNMCTNDQTKPLSAIHALQFCNQNFYPNLFKLLTILATIPVTAASAKASENLSEPEKHNVV